MQWFDDQSFQFVEYFVQDKMIIRFMTLRVIWYESWRPDANDVDDSYCTLLVTRLLLNGITCPRSNYFIK